ncbi:hypothetical protein BJF86_08790 [Serinicoccus sp. CNJ-927]|uniref:DUF2188 domain-containing protein n=1 Tax=Serinicoccus sp. CNJ-927 TaxID=1904970 RepID=UPI000961B795|nr:DUF2188 domain-containing protein [Serinicoccus sp. CNJ-927]OLT39493.1 hypothetical protein BJF86_08790 [Serinicoccus sp. CNJ-927]
MAGKKPGVETYREDGAWKNRVQGNQRASNTHGTKAEAQVKGREMARERGTEHLIKKMDGTIGERNSYGNDPHPPKG